MKPSFTLCLSLLAIQLHAADTNALTLVKTIPLPDVRGRIDHFAFDSKGGRLFMAALGNDTVEVIDLAAGKRIHTITGCSEPQGLAYVPAKNRLVIANGSSGEVEILDADSLAVFKTLTGMPDADNVRYDEKSDLIYVGYGEGALAIIRATTTKKIGDIKLAGHPESFQLEQNGKRIFVNVPDAGHIAVVDRETRTVTTTWPMSKFHANFPMALDEANHRFFVGCRHPARLVVIDTTTGKQVTDTEISSDTDDLFYDADQNQIFVSCGGGSIDVIKQAGADSYKLQARIPTESGARTSFFSPDRRELYLAIRAGLISGKAEVRVYKSR
jgi:DNA-binding beta-propeller fold protein YncE